MKKKFLIILGVIIVLLVLTYGIIFFTDYYSVAKGKMPVFAVKTNDGNYQGCGYSVKVEYYKDTTNIEKIEMYAFGKTIVGVIFCYDEINDNVIIIEDGKIKNENLLDTFIKDSQNKQNSSLQINNISNEKTEIILLEYIQGEDVLNDNISENSTTISSVLSGDATVEEYQKYYGYYKVTTTDKEEKFDDMHWDIRRQTTDNKVKVIFYGYFFDLSEIPLIFEYDLDSSLYEKKYELTYIEKENNELKKIAQRNEYDNIDYELYTLEGDVIITKEQDMVYSLEDALSKNIITVQSILDQAKLDEKYGICETEYYKDGGSVEYRYQDYTILKFNTIEGNGDLIIGRPNSIINNENLKKNYT